MVVIIMSKTIYPLLAKCVTTGAAALQMACSAPQSKPALAAAPVVVPSGKAQHGIASIYTDSRTASGERFCRHSMTGAHKTIKLGSKVKVTNLRNDKSVIVRINDRGPYVRGRIIDLTPAAAAELGFSYRQGIAKVKVEEL